jgi:hypothetical protein
MPSGHGRPHQVDTPLPTLSANPAVGAIGSQLASIVVGTQAAIVTKAIVRVYAGVRAIPSAAVRAVRSGHTDGCDPGLTYRVVADTVVRELAAVVTKHIDVARRRVVCAVDIAQQQAISSGQGEAGFAKKL